MATQPPIRQTRAPRRRRRPGSPPRLVRSLVSCERGHAEHAGGRMARAPAIRDCGSRDRFRGLPPAFAKLTTRRVVGPSDAIAVEPSALLSIHRGTRERPWEEEPAALLSCGERSLGSDRRGPARRQSRDASRPQAMRARLKIGSELRFCMNSSAHSTPTVRPEGACRSRHLCRPSKRPGAVAVLTKQPPRRRRPGCS